MTAIASAGTLERDRAENAAVADPFIQSPTIDHTHHPNKHTQTHNKNSTALGIRCKDGVVLAVEKLVVSKLLVERSSRRIHNVDRHAGIVSDLGGSVDGAVIDTLTG